MALVLAVDDEATVRAFVADTLAPEGDEVDRAQDGVDALYLLKRRSYDVIVSDYLGHPVAALTSLIALSVSVP